MKDLSIDINFKPQIVNDLYVNPMFINNNGNGYYIIGSKINDSNILVKSENIITYKHLLQFFDGEKSIKEAHMQGYGELNELVKIVNYLNDKGFLYGSNKEKSSFNEAEIFSKKLFEINKKKWSRTFIKISNLISTLMSNYVKILLIGVIIYSFLLALFLFAKIDLNDIKNIINIKDYIYLNIIMVPMLVLHEIGHAICSVSKGLGDLKISFSFFWYCIPMIYISHKNIYSLKKSDAILVILSGVIMNLFLLLIFLTLYAFTEVHFLLICAIANLRIILINLLPISLTDGYFACGLLSNTPNIRLNMYKCLANPKYFNRLIFKNKVLVIVSIISIVTIIQSELLIALKSLKISSTPLFISSINVILMILIIKVKKRHIPTS